MVKVIDIENIKLPSLNNKYISRSFNLTPEYRRFKEMIEREAIKPKQIEPPYILLIEFTGYIDIDNCIKPIADALQSRCVIDNDKNILSLTVNKTQIKRGRMSSLRVWLGHLKTQEEILKKGV